MVLRFQNEKVTKVIDYDPPCDCIDPTPKTESNYSLRKVDPNEYSGNCRTIDVYPQPNIQGHSIKKEENIIKDNNKIPMINTEENPNIFYFRIRRKCKNSDGKHNVDLEFRSPRPWRKRDWY